MKSIPIVSILLLVFFGVASPIHAQSPPPAPNGVMLDSTQLGQLLGPIALYPDPLIAQILPAATQPSEIAVAYNYVTQGGDPNGIDQQNWDPSVKAIAHYPDVLTQLDQNISWTAELGQAFLNQPSDVMNVIQSLRAQAADLGNLESSPEETVTTDDGEIDIDPTDADLLYVPVYDPGLVFYQRAYGRPFITFGAGFRYGAWLNHDFDWHDHRLLVWGKNNPRPANFWHSPVAQRRQEFSHATDWHSRGAPRPGPGNVATPYRGDRGYAPPPARVETAPRRENPVQVHTMPAERTVTQRIQPVRSAPSAFNGVENARDTRAASTRGEQSRGISHPAPVVHSAPASHPSGGGGGRKH
jgi:hypothetical protein